MKNIIKYCFTFILLIICFNLLLYFNSLYPSNMIEEKVKESAKILRVEGNKPKFKGTKKIVNNNFTDAIMINNCYSINNKEPFYSYMVVRKNYKEGLTKNILPDTQKELKSYSYSVEDDKYNPTKELYEFMNGNTTVSVEYARYWHGYIAFLRPMLLLFNVIQIRALLLVLFIILLIILLYLINKKLGLKYAIIFYLSIVMYDYFYISYSLESSPIFITMMISSIILLLRIDKIKSIYLYFFVVACIGNYVDFLTVPIITLGIPLYIYIIYKQNKESLRIKDKMKIIILSTIIWGLGYGLTWLSKWVICDIVLKKGIIANAINQVIYRTVMPNQASNKPTYYVVLFCQYIELYKYIIVIILSIEISTIVSLIKGTVFETLALIKDSIKESLPILLISVYPIIWYFVLSNHTIIHSHFTYRQMIIFLIGCVLYLDNLVELYEKRKITH